MTTAQMLDFMTGWGLYITIYFAGLGISAVVSVLRSGEMSE